MINRNLFTSLASTFHCGIFFLVLSGCSPKIAELNPSFDPAKVGSMKFALDPSEEFSTIVEKDRSIPAHVAENLAGWGYAISSRNEVEQTHKLTAMVGKIKLGPTPVGFSFTVGNSDPRALDYQKEEIFPITCYLSSKDDADKITAELTMDFAGQKFLKYRDSEPHHAELIAQLIDDISTVCYNLLSGLNVPTYTVELPTDPTTHVPAWAPAISIETIPADSPTPLKTKPAQAFDAPSGPEQSSQSPDNTPETNRQRIKKDPRKHIIIRNQGSDVIFTFGHERK